MIASIVWDVDPILFKVGSWEVRWYGLMWRSRQKAANRVRIQDACKAARWKVTGWAGAIQTSLLNK